jgi:hypothetical protein
VLGQDPPARRFLPQIRALALHRDPVTGADLVYAGDTRGVYVGAYEGGGLRWGGAPEFSIAGRVPDNSGRRRGVLSRRLRRQRHPGARHGMDCPCGGGSMSAE